MDHHADLPLFRWTPPQVEVIPFPCRSRIGKARRVADMIFGTTDRGAEAYWLRTLSDLRRQMARVGIPDDRIEMEIDAFRVAVQKELDRRAYAGQISRPGGDAA